MEAPRMKMLSIKKLSPAVMSRIRNGHKVRLMEGTGTQLVVHPEQFDAISKSFLKKKGIQVALSPSEIDANRVVEGEGIFGKKFDKALDKAGIKKAVYKVGAVLKPLAQEAVGAAQMAAISYGVPPSIAAKIGDTASQYIEDPKSLQGKKGLKELGKRGLSVASEVAEMGANYAGIDPSMIEDAKASVKEAKAMKKQAKEMKKMTSGKQMKSMARGQAESAVLGKLQQMVDARRSVSAPMPVSTDLYSQFDRDGIIGNGMRSGCCQMCKGSGLYAGAASGRGLPGMAPARDISKKFVNVSKKLMGGELQALSSQPLDANYAFKYAR
jgi:hypothetical protein